MTHWVSTFHMTRLTCFSLFLILQLNIGTGNAQYFDNGALSERIASFLEEMVDIIGEHLGQTESPSLCIPKEASKELSQVADDFKNCELNVEEKFSGLPDFNIREKQCRDRAINLVYIIMSHVDPHKNYCSQNEGSNLAFTPSLQTTDSFTNSPINSLEDPNSKVTDLNKRNSTPLNKILQNAMHYNKIFHTEFHNEDESKILNIYHINIEPGNDGVPKFRPKTIVNTPYASNGIRNYKIPDINNLLYFLNNLNTALFSDKQEEKRKYNSFVPHKESQMPFKFDPYRLLKFGDGNSKDTNLISIPSEKNQNIYSDDNTIKMVEKNSANDLSQVLSPFSIKKSGGRDRAQLEDLIVPDLPNIPLSIMEGTISSTPSPLSKLNEESAASEYFFRRDLFSAPQVKSINSPVLQSNSLPKLPYTSTPYLPNVCLPQLPSNQVPPLPKINWPRLPSNFPPRLPNINLPQLPNYPLPNLRDTNFPELPKASLPSLPDINLPQLPNMHVPEAPNLNLRELPNMHVPEAPNLNLPQLPNLNVPEAPNLNLPQLPNLNVPEAPNLNLPQLPNLNVPEAPNLNLPQLPNLNVAKAPNLNLLQLPNLNVADAPNLNLLKLPNTRVPYLPNLNLAELPNMNVPEGPNLNLLQLPNARLPYLSNLNLPNNPSSYFPNFSELKDKSVAQHSNFNSHENKWNSNSWNSNSWKSNFWKSNSWNSSSSNSNSWSEKFNLQKALRDEGSAVNNLNADVLKNNQSSDFGQERNNEVLYQKRNNEPESDSLETENSAESASNPSPDIQNRNALPLETGSFPIRSFDNLPGFGGSGFPPNLNGNSPPSYGNIQLPASLIYPNSIPAGGQGSAYGKYAYSSSNSNKQSAYKNNLYSFMNSNQQSAFKNPQLPSFGSSQSPGSAYSSMNGAQQSLFGNNQLPIPENFKFLPSSFPSTNNLPTLGSAQLPSLPNVNFPALGNNQLPSLPNINLPTLGSAQLPSLPNINFPASGNNQLPPLPNGQFPNFQNNQPPPFPNVQFPNFPNNQLPSLPNLNFPRLGNNQIPSMPNIKLPDLRKSDQPSTSNDNLPSLRNDLPSEKESNKTQIFNRSSLPTNDSKSSEEIPLLRTEGSQPSAPEGKTYSTTESEKKAAGPEKESKPSTRDSESLAPTEDDKSKSQTENSSKDLKNESEDSKKHESKILSWIKENVDKIEKKITTIKDRSFSTDPSTDVSYSMTDEGVTSVTEISKLDESSNKEFPKELQSRNDGEDGKNTTIDNYEAKSNLSEKDEALRRSEKKTSDSTTKAPDFPKELQSRNDGEGGEDTTIDNYEVEEERDESNLSEKDEALRRSEKKTPDSTTKAPDSTESNESSASKVTTPISNQTTTTKSEDSKTTAEGATGTNSTTVAPAANDGSTPKTTNETTSASEQV